MKKSKDYWEPVYNELIESYPEFCDKIVDWYPSGQMEITIRLRDDTKMAYDWMNKTLTVLHDTDEPYDESEEEWRIRFSRKLYHKMRNVGMSQIKLARDTGITPGMINKYTRGTATPSTYNLRKMASVLKCSVNELIF